MSVSAFPVSKPIEISDQPLFEGAFHADPPVISEFTFTNLYAWRTAYAFRFSILDQCIILAADIGQKRYYLPPIGVGGVRAAATILVSSPGNAIIRAPESLRASLAQDNRYISTADRDNADYLYAMADLANLSGRKYDGKRNLVKKFKSLNSYEYVPITPEIIPVCMEFQERWCIFRDCDGTEGLRNERDAIAEMFGHFERFHLFGGAIRVSGAICAVAVGQRLNGDTAVMHILKADPQMQGLYQVMLNEFALRYAGSYAFLNMEQDLGSEGLRKSKLSYHPVAMVDKYSIAAI